MIGMTIERMRRDIMTVHEDDRAWIDRVKRMSAEQVTNIWKRMVVVGKIEPKED